MLSSLHAIRSCVPSLLRTVCSFATSEKKPLRLVVIGGVAAGGAAATRARRLSEDAEITVIERGPYASFANCGLPYHIGKVIDDRSALIVTPPERFAGWYNIDLRTRTAVKEINRREQTVTCVPSLGNPYTLPYDRLVIATGAMPIIPNLPGVDLPNVHSLRNLEDMDKIVEALPSGSSALVVGAGFIGIEMAENLKRIGCDVHLVDAAPQVMPPFDPEMTEPLSTELRNHGVQLRLSTQVEKITPMEDGRVRVRLDSGEHVAVDGVIISVGVRPDAGLARRAGLASGPRGGILVDKLMQTSDPNIYAAGDVVEVTDCVRNLTNQLVPLAGPANRQGRIAAMNIFGKHAEFRGSQMTSIIRAWDWAVGSTGPAEKFLIESRTPFRKVYLHENNHAEYYPGAGRMSIKVCFCPLTGRILSGQVVGNHEGVGVAKRVDVLSTAIQANMTVFDLEESELCYAPPFGSAKDPINQVGFVASGVMRSEQKLCYLEDVLQNRPEQRVVVDVRRRDEFEEDHIPGAINVPLEDLRHRADDFPADQDTVLYCRVGMRGYMAQRVLEHHGKSRVQNLSGGIEGYQKLVPPHVKEEMKKKYEE